ncbi:hypothetical protein [Solimonas marina]|uniref:hypothetical protein n=1 Tax=Solimonas marina TaxID=2714601 RepID=UPI00344B5B7B
MEREVQTLVARLSAHRVLSRKDPMVRKALTDDLFYSALSERLAACGLEFVEHPYADHVALRVKREFEQPVFGSDDAWLSNNLELKRDQIALLVVLWALLILPKRQRQIERQTELERLRQSEMFAEAKPIPTAAELGINVAEATLLADFGERLGGRTRIKNFGLPVLSRLGFIERRDGRIYEGPLLDLVLDYNRMAQRILNGTLSELFGGAANDEDDDELPPPANDDIDTDAEGVELQADADQPPDDAVGAQSDGETAADITLGGSANDADTPAPDAADAPREH